MPTRRQLLMGTGALLGASALPRLAAAEVAPVDRRFVFVFARGGWDNTRIVSPVQGLTGVVQEEGATTMETAGLPWVDHPDRPVCRAFFEAMAHRVAVFDGLLVRSVNHRVCERLALTGTSRPGSADWATRLAAPAGSQFALPSVVLGGPSLPGPLQRYSALVGSQGQLGALLDGELYDWIDQPVAPPVDSERDAVEALLQARVERRLAEATDPGMAAMLDGYDDGLARVQRLRQDAVDVGFSFRTLAEQAVTGADLLAKGVARCVSMAVPGFDTHAANAEQSRHLDGLFDGLRVLHQALAATPGHVAATLEEETVVVVLSEMGRTPYLNIRAGKDHWPYTAAMMWGPGVRGGTRIGGYDNFLNGLPVDPSRGGSGSVVLTPQHLGATLAALGGLDPLQEAPDGEVVEAVLA